MIILVLQYQAVHFLFFFFFLSSKRKSLFFPPYFLYPPHGSQYYWSRKFSLGVLSLFLPLEWIVPHQLLLFHCFHCSFMSVWALFRFLSAFQKNSVIITAPFSAACVHCEPGGVPPVWTTLNFPISFSPPFHLLFVCLDSTTSHLHYDFLPLKPSWRELCVPVWSVSSLCGGSVGCLLGYSKTQGIEILLLFMFSEQTTCFSMSVF